MTTEEYLNLFASVEKLATGGKLYRLMKHPLKYLFAITYRELFYRFSKNEIKIQSTLFNGCKFTIALPASTDIFLTGGKSHDSEIRLAKYLIQNLSRNSVLIDVGAHYGYFSLIASTIAKDGMVYSFEPSTKSFKILQANLADKNNVMVLNQAVSEKSGTIVFYEFDNLHSEYNSTQISQFESAEWFKGVKPLTQQVQTVSLSAFCDENGITPHFIKIDVEGFENAVIKGGEKLFSATGNKPIVIMEYLDESRGNIAHKEAGELLSSWGYSAHKIDSEGKLCRLKNVEDYLQKSFIDSDNIVFVP